MLSTFDSDSGSKYDNHTDDSNSYSNNDDYFNHHDNIVLVS
jgi:hypothetical protein